MKYYLECEVTFGIEANSREEAKKKLWLDIINNEKIRDLVPFEDCEIFEIFTEDKIKNF